MKIALSASFFNCSAVAEILNSCDIVLTSNEHAIENFQHDCMILFRGNGEMLARKLSGANDIELVTFSHLLKAFHKWVVTASDADLQPHFQYFRSTLPARIRRMSYQYLQASGKVRERIAQ